MNLRCIAALALAGALAGCASVKDIRERDPVFFGSTARSADQYVTCVESAWQGNGTTAERQTVRNGYERSEEHTSELQSLMRISYAVFCLKQKTTPTKRP